MPIVGIERAFNDPAVGLRCIDHCPLAAAYCNVTVINDYISAFDVVDIVVALIAGAAAPHVTRHVALRNACLVNAPVYKTGAVKHVRPFSAANVATTEFAPRNADKPVDTLTCAFTGAGSGSGPKAWRRLLPPPPPPPRRRFRHPLPGRGAHRIIGEQNVHGMPSDFAVNGKPIIFLEKLHSFFR